MTSDSIWPENDSDGEEALAWVFDSEANRPDIRAWAARLQAEGIEARVSSKGDRLAVLHVPEYVPTDRQDAWIEAHRPPAGWGGILLLVVLE